MTAVRRWMLLGMAVLAGSASFAAAPGVPSAEDLAQRAAAAWDPVRVSLKAIMTVERRSRPASTAELLIRRSGSGRTRVDFLSPPRDRGKIILESGSETWLYLPRTGRVVEVPARRKPLAGGVLFEDLFPGGTGAAGSVVEEQDDAFVLIAGGSGGRQARSRIYFDRATLLPFRREIYTSSGRLLKTLHVDATLDWQGTRIPSTVRLVDHLRHSAETRIEILGAEQLDGDLEEIFSRDSLRPAAADGSPESP